MNTNTIISIVVVLALLIVGGLFLFSNNNDEGINETPSTATGMPIIGGNDTAETQINEETNSNSQSTPPAQTPTVTYTDTGFNPKSVTITKGQSVTFINQSGGEMWVASAMHPSHTEYAGMTRQEHCPDTAGTAFDQCGAGSSYTFSFEKSGSWNYHNHLRASDFGTVIVN